MQANAFYNASAADQATNNLVDEGTLLLHGDPNKVNPDGTHDTGFFGKQGQDMMDAYGTTHQQLQDLIKNHRENLPSGQAQLEYDRNSRRWLQIQQSEMGRAYDTAQRGWMINNNTVSGKQALDEISRSATDDKAFAGYLENLKTAYGKTAQVHGLGAAGNQEAVRNATRDAWKVRLESLALTDPARAEKLAVENQGLLGADEGPALVTKYKKAAETADVHAGVQESIAANIGKPTSELTFRAPGEHDYTTSAAPGRGAVVYGDSLGAGVKAAYGLGGDAVEKRNPSQVLAAIQSAPAGSLAGKPIILSTGASNDVSRVDMAGDQIAAAVSKGANPADITVMGVGDRPDFKGVNEKLQAIATKAGAKFLPIDPAKLSGDRVHPASYKGILGGEAAAPAPTSAAYDPNSYHARTVGIELGNQPLTTTNASGHMGPVQASRDWWNEFGAGGSPFNLNDSIAALDRETARNQPVLTGVLGHDPSGAELYLAHQQGLGGAAALLSRPGANVIDALAPAYKGNRASAMQAVLANGGNVNMTAGQFSQMWMDRYNGAHPSGMGRTLGPGQTMRLPPEASGSAPAAATLEGAPRGIVPSTYTPTAAEAAKPLDAPPEPETPEEKLERLTLAKDASLAYALSHHPEWNDGQQREAARQIELEFTRFTIATQMDAHTRKVHKDALGDKVAGMMLNGQPDQAFAMVHDPKNGLTNTERLAMSNAIEKQVGKSDPATLGPAYGDFLKRVLAPPGSEDRIGIGDADKIFQGVGNGLTMRGAKEVLSTVGSIQKSVDEFGNQKMIDVALARAKDKLLHEEDIGAYHVRDEHGVTAYEQFTNKFLTEYNKYREKGYDPKGFNLFDPAEADKVMDGIYPLRQRIMNRMGAAAEAPQEDQMVPAPQGVDAKAWNGLMAAPPIIDHGTKIVPHQIWGKALGMLLSDPSPQMIAAFDNSALGKAAGNDAATLIEGLTGNASVMQQGSGAPTPRDNVMPKRLPTPEEDKQKARLMDIGGAVKSLFHVGEAHPATETPAQRALRYGVKEGQ